MACETTCEDICRTHYEELCRILHANPTTLISFTVALFSKKVIDSKTKSEVLRVKGFEGADTLLNSVMLKIQANSPQQFNAFIEAALKEDALCDLGQKMKSIYDNNRTVTPTPTSPPYSTPTRSSSSGNAPVILPHQSPSIVPHPPSSSAAQYSPNQPVMTTAGSTVGGVIERSPEAQPLYAIDVMKERQCRLPELNMMQYLPFRSHPNPIQSPSMAISPPEHASGRLEDLYFAFRDLVLLVRDMIEETALKGVQLKEYLCDMIRDLKINHYKNLDDELRKLPSYPSVREVFGVLLSFLCYDRYYLLKYFIERFLPNSMATQKIAKYEVDYNTFHSSHFLGTLADAHPRVFNPSSHHYSNTSVAMHLNGGWESRPYDDLTRLRNSEFGQPTSDAFRMVHMSRHSILVVWETTYTVVNELCVNCVQRYSHLGSQGVLQLLIGRYQLDYTMDKNQPRLLYQLQPVMPSKERDLSMIPENISAQYDPQTLSDRLPDTGPRSLDVRNMLSDEALQNCSLLPVYASFQSPSSDNGSGIKYLSLAKGQYVRVVSYDQNGHRVLVVNSMKEYGYVPFSVFLRWVPINEDNPSLSESLGSQSSSIQSGGTSVTSLVTGVESMRITQPRGIPEHQSSTEATTKRPTTNRDSFQKLKDII